MKERKIEIEYQFAQLEELSQEELTIIPIIRPFL